MISGKLLRDAIISGANNINNQRSRADELIRSGTCTKFVPISGMPKVPVWLSIDVYKRQIFRSISVTTLEEEILWNWLSSPRSRSRSCSC